MKLLSWFRSHRSDCGRRFTLADSLHWDVHGVDLYQMFSALPALAPSGATLALADGEPSPELGEFLDQHRVALSETRLRAAPSEFEHASLIPVDSRTMGQLARLCQNLAEPEIAIHLAVFDGEGTLLEWYDLPDDPVAIAGSVAEDVVARFAAATGGRHQRSEPGA